MDSDDEKLNNLYKNFLIGLFLFLVVANVLSVIYIFKPVTDKYAAKEEAINQKDDNKQLSGKEIIDLTTKYEGKYEVVNTTNNPIDYEDNYKVYIDFDRNLLIIMDK